MIERICPKCNVPMNGDYCVKQNCNSRTEISSTIYWCNQCNVPIFEKDCSVCGCSGTYIATDLRPVFPEENILFKELKSHVVEAIKHLPPRERELLEAKFFKDNHIQFEFINTDF